MIKFRSGGLWMALDSGASLMSTAIIGAVIPRYLGPETYGVFATVMSAALVFSLLIQMNLESTLFSRGIDSPRNLDRLLGVVVATEIIAGLILLVPFALAVSAASSPTEHSSATFLLILFSCLSSVIGAPGRASVYLSLKEKFREVAMIGFATTTLGFVGRMGFVLYGWPLYSFGLILIAENICRSFLVYLMVTQAGFRGRWLHISARETAELLMPASFGCLFPVMGLLFLRIELFASAYLFDKATVGFIAAALRITALASTLLSAVFFPHLVLSYQANRTKDESLSIQSLLKEMLPFAALASLIQIATAPLIIPLLLGVQYSPAIFLTQIAALSTPLVLAAQAISNSLWAAGEGKFLVLRTIGLLLLKVLLIGSLAWAGAGPWIVCASTSIVVLISIPFLDLPRLRRVRSS